MPEFHLTEILEGSRPRKIAPGYAAVSPSTWSVEGLGDFNVEIVVTVDRGTPERTGRFVCESLKISRKTDGPPVTPEAVRQIPVATLIRTIAKESLLNVDQVSPSGISLSRRRVTKELASKIRAEGPTQNSLEWVARIYRQAVILREAPTKAVETQIGIPRSTAGRWVALARRRGFLGASEGPGKAGG